MIALAIIALAITIVCAVVWLWRTPYDDQHHGDE